MTNMAMLVSSKVLAAQAMVVPALAMRLVISLVIFLVAVVLVDNVIMSTVVPIYATTWKSR